MTQISIAHDDFDAVLFDMDGVVTRTAAVHFAAWKSIFDSFLQARYGRGFSQFTQQDYLDYVDGKPREDGIKSFLDSRKISLPPNAPRGDLGAESIAKLARQKDDEFLRLIHRDGVEPYETTITLIKSLREAGIKIALVTASRNGEEILRVTHTGHLFDATVTGIDAAKLKLRGKPAPDVFLEAARRLSVPPDRAIVVEDAAAGVESGKNGRFGLVIGVARQGNTLTLKEHGADVVVRDLAEVKLSQRPDAQADIPGMAMSDLDVTDANWIVEYDNYDPAHEQRRESLCALGNGKFCTRGASTDSQADGIHYPGTYIAGGYNMAELQSEGDAFEREELVNMPNWLCLNFRIGRAEWFSIDQVEILEYRQRLNLREGVLYRDLRVRDGFGRETQLTERRFVHMQFPHLSGIELAIVPINWSDTITLRSALDGTVLNSGDQIDPNFKARKHLKTLANHAAGETIMLKVMTNDSHLVVAQAARTQCWQSSKKIDAERENISEAEYIGQDISLHASQSDIIQIEKICSIFTSRDFGIYEPESAALEAVQNAPTFQELLDAQVDSWRSLWRQFDLFIETTEEFSKLVPSLLLHLNSFHCLQSASTHTVDLDCGIPARGWTGEGYQGHVFWDDLFVFPFINLRMPHISAALLKYRYRRLGEARKIAAAYGARGACFPWQSAGAGKECTPHYWWLDSAQKWIRDYTHLEIHVNGAIAYNIWQYYQVTADTDFMYSFGSEILLEIARFFATYAKFNPQRKRYEIHGVIGPDEFHNGYENFEKPGVNNNAYTNILAVWTISRALELLRVMPADHQQHICRRLNVTEQEIDLWQDVSSKMFIPIMDNGIVAQFEGYDQLQEFPGLPQGEIDRDALARLFRENSGYLNQYKISKQADVLMLGFLFSPGELNELVTQLGYPQEAFALSKMAEFYIPRTANASTLSRVAHAWVLSRLGRLVNGKQMSASHFSQGEEDQVFYQALGSDYFDVAARGTAKSGIHMGAMAGTVDIVQRCYTGIVMRDDVLWLDPALPKQLVRLSFNLYYRDQSIGFDIHQDKMQISVRHSTARPIKIGYGKQVYELNAGDTRVIPLHHISETKPRRLRRGRTAGRTEQLV